MATTEIHFQVLSWFYNIRGPGVPLNILVSHFEIDMIYVQDTLIIILDHCFILYIVL